MMRTELTLADAIEALVAGKRAVGYKYVAEAAVLARFEAFTRDRFPGLDTITEASAHAWIEAAQRRAVRPATRKRLKQGVVPVLSQAPYPLDLLGLIRRYKGYGR